MKIPNPFPLASAICRLVRAKLAGRKLKVAKAVETARLNVCNSCPRLDLTYRQCLECTCFVDWKVPFATEQCPLGKWKTELFLTAG